MLRTIILLISLATGLRISSHIDPVYGNGEDVVLPAEIEDQSYLHPHMIMVFADGYWFHLCDTIQESFKNCKEMQKQNANSENDDDASDSDSDNKTVASNFTFNMVQCKNAQILNHAQEYGSAGVWAELAKSILFREKLLSKCYDSYLLLDDP